MGPGGPLGGGGVPPSGKPNSKMLLIIGAAVLALIVLAVGTVAALSRGNSATAGGASDPGTSGGAASTPSAPPAAGAANASDAVRSYLEALAAGKASTALALSSETPADKTFLTDAVLAESNARAPITKINVPAVSGDYVFSVDASYTIGSEPINQKFSVTKVGNGYKVRQGYTDVDLKYVRSKTLPMMINKVAVKTDKVRLFPGSYDITSGNSLVNYGDTSTLTIKSPTDYASSLDLKPTLSKAGESTIIKAIQAKLASCAKSTELRPSGCPNAVQPTSSQKVDTSTIKWALDKDSIANLEPELDYDNPAVATVRIRPEYTFTADGSQFGNQTKFSSKVTAFATVKTNVTEQPLKFTVGR